MEKIKNGIVFSEDIKRIMEGKNALNFDYNANGLIVPTDTVFANLRWDFKDCVNKIFAGKVTIISEEEMIEAMNLSLSDVLGGYPHCFTR